ncbi:hypothetical protein JCM8097_002685 [Rhodosporidiobolus ruineniae]
MRFLLPRAAGAVPSPTPTFFSPSYRTLHSTLQAQPAPRRFSCSSNSGRSSSRDGSDRVKSSQPEGAPSSSSSRSASNSAATPRPCAPPAPLQRRQPSPSPVSRYEVPHASRNLVGLDAFFADHRPLLELPLQLSNRRSTRTPSLPTAAEPAIEDAEIKKIEALLEQAQGRTVRIEGGDLDSALMKVVDVAEDGTPTSAPYFVRTDAVEPLKSVEEELAAEQKEEQAMRQKVEQLHDQEAESGEPYDAWMIGQHQVQPAPIARYLAVHPPFAAPSSPSSSSAPTATPVPTSQLHSHLAFLSPFTSSASATPSAPSPSSAFPNFADFFVSPLEPHESSALADQFLSSAQMKQAWAARNAYIRHGGEALRKASQAYAGVAPETQAEFPMPTAKEAAAPVGEVTARGTVRIWDENEGWQHVRLGQNELALVGGEGSPFLPAEMVEVEDVVVSMDSVKRKRHKKMLKHKYKKRRKAQRALRQRLGK